MLDGLNELKSNKRDSNGELKGSVSIRDVQSTGNDNLFFVLIQSAGTSETEMHYLGSFSLFTASEPAKLLLAYHVFTRMAF